jgi:hypothetical protein
MPKKKVEDSGDFVGYVSRMRKSLHIKRKYCCICQLQGVIDSGYLAIQKKRLVIQLASALRPR